mgnify:CR=1 FL=1
MNDSLERLEDELRRCIDAHAQLLDYTRQSPSARFYDSHLILTRAEFFAQQSRLLMEESLKILRKDQTKWMTS